MALERPEVCSLIPAGHRLWRGKVVAHTGSEDQEEGCPDKMRPGVSNWICCYLGHVTAFLHIPGDKG